MAPDYGTSFVKLSVQDTGVGMAPELMREIFKPFFTTKSLGKGTGIGLATVENIVRQAGGSIEVSSTLGAGTRFDLYFPASHVAASVSTLRPTGDLPRGAGHIALVEDQPALRALAEEQLRELGYQVTTFTSAEDAFNGLQDKITGWTS